MTAPTTTLITGAASGLGWSLARAAFARGHSVLSLIHISEPTRPY